MKRCPVCRRVETDDALVFCRADGTALVSDSGSVSAEAGTAKFGSAPVASEVLTSVLPQHVTDAGVKRPTAPTTVLDRQQTIGRTHQLARPKRTKAIVFVGCLSIHGDRDCCFCLLLSVKKEQRSHSISCRAAVCQRE